MQKHYRRSNSLTGGAYIFYVNGEYRGDNELGKLMHDFNCHDAEDMNYALIADRTRYLKENPKGVTDMCKSMEDNQVLINYLVEGLGGNVGEEYADPYGQGRITIIGG